MTAQSSLSWTRRVAHAVVIGALYYIAGRFGLFLAIPPGYATAVWPASGIALAGILATGYHVWPGIALGSFLINISTALDMADAGSIPASVLLAGSIGLGAAFQAMVGAFLIRRLARFPNSLSDERDVITFLIMGGPVSCLIGATVGVSSLWAAGVIQPAQYLFSWSTWWVGDTIGALVFTPLLLVWTVTPGRDRRARALAVSLPLAVMFVLAVVLFVYASRWEQNRIRAEFEGRAQDLAQTLERNFNRSLDVVHVLETLFVSAITVDPQEFHQFAKGMLSRHSGIHALSWNPLVRDADRRAYEAAARKDGYEDFQITELDAQRRLMPAARRSEYVPVQQLEPYQGNERALGFDVLSDPVRADALIRARDSGTIQASKPIALVQDNPSQAAVLVLMPIYQQALPHNANHDRRQNLRGYVAGVFRVPEMVRTALEGVSQTGIDIRLYDDTTPQQRVLLLERAGGSGSHPDTISTGPTLQWQTTFNLAGRRWLLSFAATQEYLAAHRSLQAWSALAGGLLCTGLLGALLLVITGRTAKIRELVQQRTTELQVTNQSLHEQISERERVQTQLLKSRKLLADAQAIAQLGSFEWWFSDMRITWSEELWRIHGVPPHAFTPTLKNLLSRVHRDDRAMVKSAFARAYREGESFQFEGRIVRPDGTVRVLATKGEVVAGTSGDGAKVVGTCQDITERKLAERGLALQYSVTRALAEASRLDEVAPKVIQAICESAHWEIGLLWTVDRSANVLRYSKSWRMTSNVSELEIYSRQATFAKGVGLPGRVWESGEPAWIPDLLRDGNVPRAPYAERDGLRAGLGVPIRLQHETIGVLEFFDREIREPERELLEMLVAACGQVGQFIHRKQEEMAKAYMADIVASSEDAIVGLTPDGVITSWNQGAARLYRYDSPEAIGRSINMLVPPECLGETAEILATLQRRGPVEHQETLHLRKDGSLIDVAITFSPILDVSGTPVGASAISRDITDEKKARQALRDSEQRLDLALSGGDLGLWDTHLPTGQVVFNERWVQMLGYRSEEIEQRVGAWERLLHPDDADRVIQAFNDHLTAQTPYYECEYRLRTKSGDWKWILARGKVVQRDPDGKPLRVTGTHLDIDQRKRAEEARREAEEAFRNSELRFRSLTQSTADAILSADFHGNILSWNSGAEKMFGYREEELLGRPLTLIMPEHYREAHSEGIARRQATGESHVIGKTVELWGLKKDGTEFPLELSLSSWRTADGEIYGGIIRDITDRRRTAVELSQARDAALESARLKSEFLANMSHEIRTPMNGIIGLSGLLLGTQLDPQQRDFAETVQHSAEALLVLANDILDFSKIEAGKLDLETVDFDLRQVVEECIQTNAEHADRKGLELACLIPQSVPSALRGDPLRLRQILANLLGNAIKFTKRGEVTVRVAVMEEQDDSATFRFEVVDTGIGVPSEAHQRIFQSFTQADGSTTRRYGGTGLGLAISKQLVDLMGGEINFDSVPGKGSTFWFTVTISKQPPRAEDAEPPRRDLHGLRVLLVDDNLTNRQILSHFAEGWGMQVDEAADARAALVHLKAAADHGSPYHIAILDLQMPDIDGFQLARAIKADPAIAAVRLVLMTSFSQGGHGQTARQVGIAAYFTKPVRQSQVFECLTKLMGSPSQPASNPPVTKPATVTPATTVKGARVIGPILVAEDNLVNQKVAVLLLEKLGYKADVAASGLKALEALTRTRYALVLMDVQMPEMDGFEATAEIRKREGTQHHTPIIAMTANAMIGEREKCLQAGMDDYLSKPVNVDALAAVLGRWLANVPPSARANPSIAAVPGAVDAVDPQVLASLRELQPAGEPDVVLELIGIFLHEVPRRLSGLQEAIAQGDCRRIEELAHSLKGSCGNLGARTMAALCGSLEKEGEKRSLGDSGVLLAQVQAEFVRVRAVLEREAQGLVALDGSGELQHHV